MINTITQPIIVFCEDTLAPDNSFKYEDLFAEHTYTDAEYDSYEEMMSTPHREDYENQRSMSVEEYLDYLEDRRLEDEKHSMHSGYY